MAHTIRDKQKLIGRIKRIQGQLASAEVSLENEHDCYKVLLTLSSARGALNGLMGEIVEGQVREHIVGASSAKEAAHAGEELVEIMKSFWK